MGSNLTSTLIPASPPDRGLEWILPAQTTQISSIETVLVIGDRSRHLYPFRNQKPNGHPLELNRLFNQSEAFSSRSLIAIRFALSRSWAASNEAS